MPTITYKGQTMVSKHHCELSDELFHQLKNDYYAKPDIETVKQEIRKINEGGYKTTAIMNYFIKEIMSKTVLWHCKWSIEDVFNCKDLLARFVAQTYTNDKVFPPDKPLIKNVETALRIGGKGVAEKPANFPLKTVDYILNKYNINNWWYDYSCGWGSRLLGALKNNINYFGTDPNYILCDKLNELSDLYKETISTCTANIDIHCCGSEEYIDKYKGKIGMAFSSPPYFNLEDYKVGNQSWKEGLSYQEWLDGYMTQTIKNIHTYLIDDGYFLININNFKEFDLVGDVRTIVENNGFTYVTTETLNNIKRCNMFGDLNDNSEGIMVFRKKG